MSRSNLPRSSSSSFCSTVSSALLLLPLYLLSVFNNSEEKNILENLEIVRIATRERNNMTAILTKAKQAYIAELKSEMLSAKSGFDFSD